MVAFASKFEHDPEKLQTFRTRSCSRINEMRAECDSIESHPALALHPTGLFGRHRHADQIARGLEVLGDLLDLVLGELLVGNPHPVHAGRATGPRTIDDHGVAAVEEATDVSQ